MKVREQSIDTWPQVLEPGMELHVQPCVPRSGPGQVVETNDFGGVEVLEELTHLGEPAIKGQDDRVWNVAQVQDDRVPKDQRQVEGGSPQSAEIGVGQRADRARDRSAAGGSGSSARSSARRPRWASTARARASRSAIR